MIERLDIFSFQRIRDVLEGTLSPDQLSAEEQEVWLREFADAMAEATEQEITFFAERRRLGRGVGLNDAGELVYSEPRQGRPSSES